MMRNRVLRRLPADEMSALRPLLTEVVLPARTVLQTHGVANAFVYFLESGFASLTATAGRERIDVGIVGREGLVGLSAVLGQDEALHDAVMQVDGVGCRMTSGDARRAVALSPGLSGILMRYLHVSVSQISQTAMANGRRTVEQRLARWLLMAHDRLDGSEISLTHDALAAILGVRRPGVTVALHMLEGVHGLRSRRNSITVLDRDKLKSIAGESYGATEALYDLSLGPVSLAA